jgi:hypothetical protein
MRKDEHQLPPEFGSLPVEQKIERLNHQQRAIIANIPRGEPEAIKMKDLASKVFAVDNAKPGSGVDHIIRNEIAFMIDHGIDIVSSSRGFYRPTRAADPYLMATRLFRQGASLMKRARRIVGARAFDQIRKQSRINLNKE